jgi:hypothetical protein
MTPSTKPLAAIGLALALAAGVAQAQTISFEAGSTSRSQLGDQIGSIYDTFTFTGASNAALDVTNPVSGVTVGQLSFEVGVNCTTCDLTPTFTESIDFAVNGVHQLLNLTYTWSSTGPIDSLTFLTPGPLSFDLGNGSGLTVTFDQPGVLSGGLFNGGAYTYRENLTATFTDPPLQGTVAPVPEPSTYALMLVGLGLVGGFVRRQRQA